MMVYHEEDGEFAGSDAEGDELRFLRFFYRKVDMGPSDDDIKEMVKHDFTAKHGIAVPPNYYPPIG
jgi:hypothetical protein